jgi:hypothetical protein
MKVLATTHRGRGNLAEKNCTRRNKIATPHQSRNEKGTNVLVATDAQQKSQGIGLTGGAENKTQI